MMAGESHQSEQAEKVNVTYEALFDLVVREKSKEDLHTLNAAFFAELVSYLGEKRSAMAAMNDEEKEKASRQLHSINRLVKELYERRERKIMSLALARSRAGVDIIDTTAILAEEKTLFDGIVKQLDFSREGVLNSLLTARMPKASAQTGAETLETASRIITEQPASAISGTKNIHEDATEKKTRLIRFIHAVPKFVGSELEVYGPFDQEDIANLPREIADVLILKGRAEEMGRA